MFSISIEMKSLTSTILFLVVVSNALNSSLPIITSAGKEIEANRSKLEQIIRYNADIQTKLIGIESVSALVSIIYALSITGLIIFGFLLGYCISGKCKKHAPGNPVNYQNFEDLDPKLSTISQVPRLYKNYLNEDISARQASLENYLEPSPSVVYSLEGVVFTDNEK